MNTGKLICFEGIDGTGKTTQAKRLQQYLNSIGVDCVLLRTPGGMKATEDIRQVIFNNDMHRLTEALLMLASHVELTINSIAKQLKEGKVVILDRYVDSLKAYQSTTPELKSIIHNLIDETSVILEPDLTIYMEADLELVSQRVNNRAELNRLDKESLEFRQNVIKNYNELYEGRLIKFVRKDASLPELDLHLELINDIQPYLITL